MRFNIFKYILLSTVLFAVSHSAMAQYKSILDRFELDYIRGCEGLTVNVSFNIPTEFIESAGFYLYGYDPDSVDISRATTHTYTEPGQHYFVMQVKSEGIFAGNQRDSILVEIIEPQTPTFTIHNCEDNLVRVEINDDYYDNYSVKFTENDSITTAPLTFTDAFDYGAVGNYRIDVRGQLEDAPLVGLTGGCPSANSGFTSIESIVSPEITSITTETNRTGGSLQLAHNLGENSIYNIFQSDSGSDNFVELGNTDSPAETLIEDLNTKGDFYCFHIDTYDACSDVTIRSDIACSVNFQVEANGDGHRLTWDTDETQAQSYVITRNDGQLAEFSDLSVKTYNDTAVICLQEYIYSVSAHFATAIGSSQDTAIIAIESGDLPAITINPKSTVLNQEVVVTWRAPSTGDIPFRQYLVERNINSRSWSRIGMVEDTLFIDNNNSFTNEHSYRISYDDDCGNESLPSPLTAPITLKQVSSRGKIVSYSWNKYETWTEGIRNYTLERLDVDGNVIEEYAVLSGRTKDIEFDIDDIDQKLIRVRAESLDEISDFTYSNIIDSRLSLEMFLPNAFTPDGDNLNDYFIAKGPAIDNFVMEIYNRWGILVFSTTDLINGWDGNINGEKSPQGTYVYKIYFEDGTGKKYDQTGSFLLLRNG